MLVFILKNQGKARDKKKDIWHNMWAIHVCSQMYMSTFKIYFNRGHSSACRRKCTLKCFKWWQHSLSQIIRSSKIFIWFNVLIRHRVNMMSSAEMLFIFFEAHIQCTALIFKLLYKMPHQDLRILGVR